MKEGMTKLLEQAISDIGTLPVERQDAIALRILAELADEQEWTTRFKATINDQWDRLSDLARQEINAGDTDPLDEVYPNAKSARCLLL